MKKIMLIILSFVVCFIVYGQSKDEYKRMVDIAIILQTKYLDQNPYNEDIYLIDANDRAYYLSLDNKKNKFSSIDVYDKKNKGRLKKGIHAWKILPILNGNRLTVNIVDFRVRYKNDNYSFANTGGAIVIFEYHCATGKWVLMKTTWSGI
ncbi:hypothetical protein [Sphingobacterium siyangense]|uniref:hypothetical protein n=1 Tax=Sphingobacterium siyangense TaxID=459529 RepID=UPI00301A7C82